MAAAVADIGSMSGGPAEPGFQHVDVLAPTARYHSKCPGSARQISSMVVELEMVGRAAGLYFFANCADLQICPHCFAG